MRVLIRADASVQIGSGHIMRCLTLAKALKDKGHEVCFLCRDLHGNLNALIREQGFQVFLIQTRFFIENQSEIQAMPLFHAQWLPVSQLQDFADCMPIIQEQSPDCLIIDHYALSYIWESQAKKLGLKIMVIDDLADRKHNADLLLDQSLGRKSVDYQQLVPENCQLLMGSSYALLRREFTQWREYSLQRRKNTDFPKHILVNLGGVDKDNNTLQILKLLVNIIDNQEVIVVMGKGAPHIDLVKQFVKTVPYSCKVLVNVNNMAQIMAKADVAIGAAGSTSWERCCLGLPTLLLILADNQKNIAEQLYKSGAAHYLQCNNINIKNIKAFFGFINHKAHLQQMSIQAAMIVDGEGVGRVLQYITKFK